MPPVCFRVLALLLTIANLHAVTYYVSPSGNDSNSGSIGSPFYNIRKAVPLVTAGDTIFVRGGTFTYTNTIKLTNSGNAAAFINIWAYTNEYPLLDFSAMADSDTNRGFLIPTNAGCWH